MGWTWHNPTGIFQSLSQSPGARQDLEPELISLLCPPHMLVTDREEQPQHRQRQEQGLDTNIGIWGVLGAGNGTIHPAWPWADTKHKVTHSPVIPKPRIGVSKGFGGPRGMQEEMLGPADTWDVEEAGGRAERSP